jgi:hypothetical protein
MTPQFIKLQKKMKETRQGEWIAVSKKIQNKYSNLVIDQITRIRKDDDLSEYKVISGDYLLNVKTFVNYVSMSIAETEYEVDSYIDVVGALNVDSKEVTIWEIAYWLNWDIGGYSAYGEKYLDFK